MPDEVQKTGDVRQQTIDEMIGALERILLRDGVRELGVNKVVREANVPKPQLYRLFDGLPGLIEEWGRRRRFWPDQQNVVKRDDAFDTDIAPMEMIKRRMVRLASMLRDDEVALEVLAEELIRPSTEISHAFQSVRRQQRALTDDEKAQEDHPAYERENFRLIHVMFAACIYFALRARQNPDLQGIRLDTEDGWNDTMKMIEEIIDDSILAAKMRQLMAEHSSGGRVD